MTQFGFHTTGQQVVAAFPDQVKGRTFVITGTSENSIGDSIASSLALAKPASLILLARSEAKVSPVIKRIQEIDSAIKTVFVPVDLSDLASVRTAAAAVQTHAPKVDVLINNAGIFAVREYITNNAGIESQFAANHVGHFLLTALLTPQLLAAGPGARVVNVSSLAHHFGPVRFDDYNFQNGKAYDPWEAYAQSKTANVLFSAELAKRGAGQGLVALSTHPGTIGETALRLAANDENFLKKLENSPIKPEEFKTRDEGSATTLVAALDPGLDSQSGKFMLDCAVTPPNPWAVDEEAAAKLWELSERLVGQKFEI